MGGELITNHLAGHGVNDPADKDVHKLLLREGELSSLLLGPVQDAPGGMHMMAIF